MKMRRKTKAAVVEPSSDILTLYAAYKHGREVVQRRVRSERRALTEDELARNYSAALRERNRIEQREAGAREAAERAAKPRSTSNLTRLAASRRAET
jgi:hypothetical protein